MMTEQIQVYPGTVTGRVKIPGSKSLCHRFIIASALADGTSTLKGVSSSRDIDATIYAMQRLGAIIWHEEDDLMINGIGGLKTEGRVERLFCGESGSTVRFLIPIAGVLGVRAVLTGLGKLPERPLTPYYDIMDAHGFAYEKESEAQLPLHLKGTWTSGIYQVPGDISSQFITGLLMALPLAEGDSVIEVTTHLESKPYVDLTLDVLKSFGIEVRNDRYHAFYIKGSQKYKPGVYSIESDFSQAANFMVAGTIAGEEDGLILDGLRKDSSQGDRVIETIITEMGGHLLWLPDGGLKVFPAKKLKNGKINVSQCPDLVPILSVLGAFGSGTMRITGAARLRLKESDRLKAVQDGLSRCGVPIHETEDGLRIDGAEYGLYEGGEADCWNDHRIAMCLSVLALRSFQGITLHGADCVGKSWPTYWEDYCSIGGWIDE